ncbi:vWA domain-containing protein [Paracoccus onubensis]|uniref:VWA domain-containing protein n=1 Tax=Paracoccus onubensis TaxID=1675788 RepID=A0A418SLZ4_9RHOB|nr:VWA domain-containing protein [Paracoccus onubensis]RJE81963.1 VWA domain-containing protein [Paracoccus onubensis]
MTSGHDDPDLDDLKRAMRAATPRPDPVRRAENLALAKKNFAATQGSGMAARQNSERSEKRGVFRGVFDMLMTRTAAAGLTATTALVAVGALFFTPAGRDLMTPPSDMSRPEVAAQPEPAASDAPAIAKPEAPAAQDLQAESTPAQPQADEVVGYNAQLRDAAPAPMARVGIAPDIAPAPPPANTEQFSNKDDNPLHVVAEDPVSTFSIDVDTASYALVRSSLNAGQMPPRDAVRVEEMINYFPYDYPAPGPEDVSPFKPTVSVFQTPWNPDTSLVHIGMQGELPAIEDRPPLNLVFLIDTSGSMDEPAKLPLLAQSFRMMLSKLNSDDQVAIVTYAGNAGIALEPTPASDRGAIEKALAGLQSEGSTNGEGGLEEAYRLAGEMSEEGEVSRVLLATDGDFNVGIDDPDALTDFISDKRDSGIYLSVLGFGRGNLQDDTMQALAQNGNGTAAYIDTLNEAQRVLVDQLAGALFPIADDVKIQVEFNPAVIAEYRLIGYETRALRREDFNNDAVDAGELGAGHSVTAIYEVTPVDSPARKADPLRYARQEMDSEATGKSDELGLLRLRWKDPGESESQLMEFPITETDHPGSEAEFAAAIAGFGQLLRGSTFLQDWGYEDAIALATANRGADEFGYRNEAVRLMRLAETLAAD